MNARMAIVIGLALAAGFTASAQDFAASSKSRSSLSLGYWRSPAYFQRARVNYLRSLNSDIPGIVESALGHVTLLRILYPKEDLGKIREKLYDLASSGPTRSIRHKAFTAMQVFADPTAFKTAVVLKQASGDGLLEALATQLETSAFQSGNSGIVTSFDNSLR